MPLPLRFTHHDVRGGEVAPKAVADEKAGGEVAPQAVAEEKLASKAGGGLWGFIAPPPKVHSS